MTYNTRIKVRGYHLDVYGHVNNARYLEFLEDARWELIEEKIDLGAWLERGLAFTIVNITINYRRAALLGDLLEVRCALSRLGEKSATVRQEIHFADTDEIVADAEVTFVVVDTKTGKALPMEGELRDVIASLG